MTQVIDLLGYDRIVQHASATDVRAEARALHLRAPRRDGGKPHQDLPDAAHAAERDRRGTSGARREGLATTRIGKLVASPMARAWRTASLVAAEHKMHPEVDGALSERFYVSLWDKPIEGAFDWDWDPDGCEPLATFVHRAAQSVMRILEDDTPDGETVIVAHGGILLVACALTDATLEHSHRRNAVPLRFSRQNGAWTATPL